ncbi:MAG TPA: NfeD family protein [Gemmatirosa sp.]
MSLLFVACFVAGLVLGVYVMLNGVERAPQPTGRAPHEETGAHDPRTEPPKILNVQTAAAFVCAFGAAGYLALRAGWSPAATLGVGLVAGLASAALSTVLLAKWALPSARRDVVDARYLMQGHPATVTRAIPAGGLGEIAYEMDGRRWTLGARGWDDSPVALGDEVAIDRVEDGVAYVEQWVQVEARL